MALIDEVKDEIKRAHAPKDTKPEKEQPRKERRQKTKEEIAAYIARKQAEEERRYLKSAEPPKRKKREGEPKAVARDPSPAPAKRRGRPRAAPAKEAYCTRPRPKTFKTIDLPDGGSIVIIYMPGATS